jgi:hypothetical protein
LIRKEYLVVCVSIVLSFLGLFFAFYTKPTYVNLYGTTPFALVTLLFPIFNLITAAFILLCFFAFYYRINNKYIHIFLLIQLALLLWYTIAYMSNYVYGLDTLSNGGIIPNAPSLLTSNSNVFSSYLHDYPGSFVFNFAFLKVAGVNLFSYAQYIHPIYWISTFILFFYVIVRRLLHNSEIAFISTAFATLGLSALEFYPTPSATGFLLVLFISYMVLLYSKRLAFKLLSLLPITALIIIHPESPVLLLVLLIAPFISLIITRSKKQLPFTIFMLLFIFAMWLSWASLSQATSYGWEPILTSIQRVLSLNFLRTTSQTLVVTGVITPFFSTLRSLIMYSFGIVAVSVFVANLTFKKGFKTLSASTVKKWSSSEFLLIVISALMIFVIVFFGLIVNPIIRSRALTYLVLAVSAFIGVGAFKLLTSNTRRFRVFKGHEKKIALVAIAVWLGFAGFVYPTASYYHMAYFSAPYSEGVGMTYFGDHYQSRNLQYQVGYLPVEDSIFTYRPTDIAFYMQDKTNFTLYFLPQDINQLPSNLSDVLGKDVNYVLFRQSLYFAYAMTLDFSYNNTLYSHVVNATDNSPFFAQVYSNPSFKIYVNTEKG